MPTLLAAGDPLSFYSTAAGVIPVIMLALAFQFGGAGFRFIPERVLPPEADAKRRAQRDAWIAFYSLVILAVLLIGEAVSLFVVAVGAPQPWWGATVAASLVVGGAGLVIPIVIAQLNAIAEGREAGRIIRNGAVVAVRSLLGIAVAASLIGAGYAIVAPTQVPVPKVVGASSAFEAENALQEAGLELAPVREQVNDSVPPGTVVAQTPAAGTSVEKGASVTLLIGVSSSMTTTPDVLGRTPAGAALVLRKARLTIGAITPQPVDPTARVREQTPAPGGRVRRGTSVSLRLR